MRVPVHGRRRQREAEAGVLLPQLVQALGQEVTFGGQRWVSLSDSSGDSAEDIQVGEAHTKRHGEAVQLPEDSGQINKGRLGSAVIDQLPEGHRPA